MGEKEIHKEPKTLRNVFVDSLYIYLENQGAAFTTKALKKRLEDFIIDPIEREYGRKNLEEVLNKLITHGRLDSTQHNGETHYFIPKKYYVPVNYSHAWSVIPKGEDIIYSTLCKARYDRGFGSIIIDITTWVTHVLCTRKGLAFTAPDGNLLYLPWYDIYHTWNDGIYIGSLKELLYMVRDTNLESREMFKKPEIKSR